MDEIFQDHNSKVILISPPRFEPQWLFLTSDLKGELFPVHSPLLRESLLVSFPPLIDMLKFSGLSCLIWDRDDERLIRLMVRFSMLWEIDVSNILLCVIAFWWQWQQNMNITLANQMKNDEKWKIGLCECFFKESLFVF